MSTSGNEHVRWRKATASAANGNCVEVGPVSAQSMVLVRDTKDRGEGSVLGFSRKAWNGFLDGAKSGEFDL